MARGLTAGDAGVLMIPMSVCLSIAGQAASRLKHYRFVAVIGLLAAVGATTMLAAIPNLEFRFVGCLLALISLGASSLFTTTMIVVLNASERRDIGSSTGFMLFARQLSAALAITAVGAWVLGAPINEGGRSLPVWPFQQVFVAAAAGFAIALVFILVIKARPLRDS